MFTKRIFPYLIILIFSFTCLTVVAQNTDSLFYNLELLKLKDVRLTSNNPSGFQYLSVAKISTAFLQIGKSNGEFKNYYMSDNSLSWGAETESYQRLKSGVVVYGKVSYTNFKGRNMGGSAFINPYKNPFNILENADSTAGTKKAESYNLTGGAGFAISKKLNAGVKLNYNAANFAKIKDLRHSNKLLDMETSAGVEYKLSDAIQIGATYIFNRRTESISFQRYGNTDRPYLSFIDFGAFYGRVELFTESIGYTDAGANLPLVNNTHSGNLELNLQLKPNLQLFNEFTYGIKNGNYGERGTNSVVFTENTSENYQYKGTANLQTGKNLHSLQLKAGFESINNYENIYSRVTTSGGVSSIIYHGKNEVLQHYNSSLGLAYSLNKNIINNNPQWAFKLFADFVNRDITTTIYPFYRTQNINNYAVGLSAKKNILSKDKMYSFSLAGFYATGNGAVNEDGVYIAPSPSQPPPASRDKYLLQEYEYFTNARINLSPAFQFSMPLSKSVLGYAKIEYQYLKAFNTLYLGNSYGTLNATLGCNF